jgi:diaminopimelate decarboxylase
MAHPAGPRHAEVHQSPTTVGNPPSDPAGLQYLEPAVWPRGTLRGEDGVVRLAGVDVRELAEVYGTPLFVFDEADFRARCREYAKAFEEPGLVHYACKAFLSMAVARWVAEEGLGLDVCSGGELAMALRAGFPPERITMHGNNKSVDELAAGLDAGVGMIVLDSFFEVARLDELARQRDVVQPVMIRATVGVEAHTHEFIATAHEDQKFGFSLAAGDAAEAARRVLKCTGLRLVGLHSHIGSQIFDADGFEIAAHRIIGLLAELHAEHGSEALQQLSTVDLGGGLGIAYTGADDPPSLVELAERLRETVARECELAGVGVPKIAVEPGRGIVGPGAVTLYEVGTIKDVELGHDSERRYVSVDGGMSDNIRTALYDAVYECAVVSRGADENVTPVLTRVVGKHCESGDIVVRDAWLQSDIAPGDLLAVAATGAYCYAMSSAYNLLPRPAVVVVAEGEHRTMLRRETVDDLFRLEAP